MATAASHCGREALKVRAVSVDELGLVGRHRLIATEILGSVQGVVGGRHSGTDVAGRRTGDPDRHGHVLAVREPDLSRCSHDSVGDLAGLVGRRIREQDAELLAAVAVHHIVEPDLVGEHRGDRAQDLVALLVAETVVDRLEVIDVDHDHGGRTGSAGAGRQVMVEPPSVGEAGQAVAPDHRCQIIVGRAAPDRAAERERPQHDQPQRRHEQQSAARTTTVVDRCHRFRIVGDPQQIGDRCFVHDGRRRSQVEQTGARRRGLR